MSSYTVQCLPSCTCMPQYAKDALGSMGRRYNVYSTFLSNFAVLWLHNRHYYSPVQIIAEFLEPKDRVPSDCTSLLQWKMPNMKQFQVPIHQHHHHCVYSVFSVQSCSVHVIHNGSDCGHLEVATLNKNNNGWYTMDHIDDKKEVIKLYSTSLVLFLTLHDTLLINHALYIYK